MNGNKVDMIIEIPLIPQNLDPMVRAAFQNWNDWRLRGAPERKIYSRGGGLCHAVGEYFYAHGEDYWHGYDLCRDLFSGPFPFGEDNYDDRCRLSIQHLDPARIAWVEATPAANPVGDEQ